MKVQVLVAAMNQLDHSLIEKMGIQTDAIVANQCGINSIEDFEWNGCSIRYLNFAEKGVGLNRNNALMRATGEICLFADDDMTYVPNYESIVLRAFNRHRDADLIAFNLCGSVEKRHVILSDYKVGFFNFLRFGTARIAVRLKSVREKGIYFNQCFGGGTDRCHGEDNIFIADCLKNGLTMYAVPECIAEMKNERESTWRRDYDEKYFADQGALYRVISPVFWKILCFQDAVRHCDTFKRNWYEVFRMMINGEKKV